MNRCRCFRTIQFFSLKEDPQAETVLVDHLDFEFNTFKLMLEVLSSWGINLGERNFETSFLM